jgi:predicted TIM-barrel fold metal-dependent hydrolase
MAELLAERDGHGVAVALVRSRAAAFGDAQSGNATLLAALEGRSGLLPIATLSPERGTSPSEADAIGPRVAGFWLDSRALPDLGSVAVEELLAAAARSGRPLFVPIARFGDATRVALATAGLGVTVILAGTHYMNAVDVLAAARRYDHLAIETSSMAHLGAIETAVHAIGAERVLLGTGSPRRAIQSSLNAIAVARISDDERRAILAGNAARLFGLPAPVVEVPTIARPERAIDTHAHLGPLPGDVPNLTAPEQLAEMRRTTGTTIAIASSVEAIDTDSESGNRATVEACRENEGWRGYLVTDPNHLDAARDHIRRLGDKPGIVGIKIGCEQSQHTDTPQIRDLFRILADYGRPVKIHNDGPGWDAALLAIAREHPRLPIIVAHGGLGTPSSEGAALTEQADNIYLEMCSSFATLSAVREVARRVPVHKFMFGTDVPLLEPAFVLGTYQDAGIPQDRETAVYYDNAARLFGLP